MSAHIEFLGSLASAGQVALVGSPLTRRHLTPLCVEAGENLHTRRLVFLALVFALATSVHLDWHFARPTHHRLSLGWEQHWLFAALAFGLVGWVVARAWPEQVWRRGGMIAALALLVAQGIEPMAEVALYLHRIGYPDEPARWTAFFVCLAAGLPAYCLALWWCRPTRYSGTSRSVSPAAASLRANEKVGFLPVTKADSKV